MKVLAFVHIIVSILTIREAILYTKYFKSINEMSRLKSMIFLTVVFTVNIFMISWLLIGMLNGFL